MYTCRWPDAFESNVKKRPSGEKRAPISSDGDTTIGVALLDPSSAKDQMSLPPGARCMNSSVFPSGETSSGCWNVPLPGSIGSSVPVARVFRKIFGGAPTSAL